MIHNLDFMLTVTTAENGKRALEYLGLADGQHPNHNVSNYTMKVFYELISIICSSWYFPWQVLKVNLIITDYSMPGMTGYELLKRIKVNITYLQ